MGLDSTSHQLPGEEIIGVLFAHDAGTAKRATVALFSKASDPADALTLMEMLYLPADFDTLTSINRELKSRH